MARDPWARPHERTVVLGGVPRRLQLARLNAGDRANVELLLAMFRMQNERLRRVMTQPIAQQLSEIAEERAANQQFGQWVEQAVSEHVRVGEPWTTEDGFIVDDGATLVDASGNEELFRILVLLYDANKVSARTAKNSESPRDSSPGSVGARQTTRGDKQARVARRAGRRSSVPSAAAGDPSQTDSRGSTTSIPASPATSAPSGV